MQEASADAEQPQAPLPEVGRIIAVGSGKGGVGKSTVAVNLAVTLARQGQRVGLLDADILGPSLHLMLGLGDAQPQLISPSEIAPPVVHGVRVMSMGFLVDDSDAIVWRGPMLQQALTQFVQNVAWGSLDLLVVDLPPGTGDVQISLSQMLPLAGALVVTTPQDVAFADVRRAIRMFELTGVPLLGIVENMSYFVCDRCDARHEIFGASHIAEHARELGLEVMGRLPIDSVTAAAADRGEPLVIAAADSPSAACYERIADRVATAISVIARRKAG